MVQENRRRPEVIFNFLFYIVADKLYFYCLMSGSVPSSSYQ